MSFFFALTNISLRPIEKKIKFYLLVLTYMKHSHADKDLKIYHLNCPYHERRVLVGIRKRDKKPPETSGSVFIQIDSLEMNQFTDSKVIEIKKGFEYQRNDLSVLAVVAQNN